MRSPSANYTADNISPSSLTLLSFITLYLRGDIPDDRDVLTFMGRQILLSNKSEFSDEKCGSIKDFHGRLACQVKTKQTLQTCEKSILKMVSDVQGVDDLLDLIANCLQICAAYFSDLNPLNFNRSILGNFCQRQIALVRLLSHSEVLSLYEYFCLYSGKVVVRTSVANDDGKRLGFEEPLPKDFSEVATEGHSRFGLSHLLNNEVELLEQYGTNVPRKLRFEYELLASEVLRSSTGIMGSATFATTHYIRYLEKLYEGDYHASFDSHQECFDYMISRGSRKFFHLALISRAALHLLFGESEKALESIEEAIVLARESKDFTSLSFILCWLYDFLKKNPLLWNLQSLYHKSDEERMLGFLIKKSGESTPSFSAFSHLLLAEKLLSQGAESSSIFQSIMIGLSESLMVGPLHVIRFCVFLSNFWDIKSFPELSLLYIKLGLRYSRILEDVDGACSLLLRRCELRLAQGSFREMDLDLKSFHELKLKEIPLNKINQARELLITHKRYKQTMKLQDAFEDMCLFDLRADGDEQGADMLSSFALRCSENGNHSSAIAMMNEVLNLRTLDNSSFSILTKAKLETVKSTILKQADVAHSNVTFSLHQWLRAKSLSFHSFAVESCLNFIHALFKLAKNDEIIRMAMTILPQVHRSCKASFLNELYYDMVLVMSSNLTKLPSGKHAEVHIIRLSRLFVSTVVGCMSNHDCEKLIELNKIHNVAVRWLNDNKPNETCTLAVNNLLQHSANGMAFAMNIKDSYSEYSLLK